MPQPASPRRSSGVEPALAGAVERRWLAWFGGACGAELGWARRSVGAIEAWCATDVSWPTGPASTDPPRAERAAEPTVAVLASAMPGLWHAADCLAIARRWPLCVTVAVGTTLGDGGRRSGPSLPGIEEIPWHELPARLQIWLADLSAGLPGTLGLPPAARREDRVLESAAAVARWRNRGPVTLAVAAPDRVALEGLTGLAASLGCFIAGESTGRPALETGHDPVIWQVESIDWEVLTWLELAASTPGPRPVVLVTPFPRGDSVLAALRAGAAAVLGHPVGLESLAGTLMQVQNRLGSGLGRRPVPG